MIRLPQWGILAALSVALVVQLNPAPLSAQLIQAFGDEAVLAQQYPEQAAPKQSAPKQTAPKQTAPNRPQRIRRSEIWKVVYQQLPTLPREDRYVERATNDASSSTLVQRLLVYHSKVRGRSPYHRFDWKLTLADYLGKNEIMSPEQYPSANRLKSNPLEGDRQALSQLDRAQRDALINTLVSLYNPRIPQPIAVTAPDPGPLLEPETLETPAPVLPERPVLQPTPQPGDAELLLPR